MKRSGMNFSLSYTRNNFKFLNNSPATSHIALRTKIISRDEAMAFEFAVLRNSLKTFLSHF